MKYTTIYKNVFSQALQYRLNLGLILVSHAISLSGLLYLWIAIYATGQTVGTYTLEALIVYYMVLIFLRFTISEGVSMGFAVCDEIRDGAVANYLVKPISYSIEHLVKLVANATLNTIIMTPFAALLAFAFRNRIDLPDVFGWLAFFGMMIVGLVCYYLIYYLAGLSSFWLHTGRAAVYAMLIFSNFFNGGLIPLDLFPAWALPIVEALPFQYLLFIPIQTFLGHITNWPHTLAFAALWIAVLSTMVWITWTLGVRKFEAVGR